MGKSSVAAYLSVSLAKRGYHVGLMDVDLHGPSIPRILGLKGNLVFAGHKGKMLPVRYLPNMEVISIETLLGENKDAVCTFELKGGGWYADGYSSNKEGKCVKNADE